MVEPEPRRARTSWRVWLVAALTGLVVFLTPLAVIDALADDPPEIRITTTGQRFSALVESEGQSVLVINSARPDEATSALGRLRRPWEPMPQIIVAPATDDAAPGIHEAVRLLEPERVLIAGLPGANPIWSRLEQLCRDRGVELEFIPNYARIDAGPIALSILGAGIPPSRPSEVIISRSGLQLAIGMGLQPPATLSQIAVVNADVPPNTSIGPVVIHGGWAERDSAGYSRVFVGNQEVVTVLLEEDRLRVKGGKLFSPR